MLCAKKKKNIICFCASLQDKCKWQRFTSSVVSISRMPGEAEGAGSFLLAPSTEGVLWAAGSRRAEPCLRAWSTFCSTLSCPASAARGAEPGLLCGPGERGSSALAYGMSRTGSLLGNPVCEQSPAFLPDGINNHCQWGWGWWQFVHFHQ